MLPLDDALRTMVDCLPEPQAARVPLAEALGLVLADDAVSDVDMPPFHKSAMDGFAVRASDIVHPPSTLRVGQEVSAGALPRGPVRPGECARIMTGAPVPEGADTVVRVEDTEPGPAADQVTFPKAVDQGRNICWKAEDLAAGDVVLEAGHRIRPPEVAVLAACGYATVPVWRRPRVAVLSTGNEVVAVEATPQGGQIRDANSPYLLARLRRLGIEATALGIAPDEPEGLRRSLAQGLDHDVLVVSGGVSMGDYDLVPGILAELGTEILFDSVAMQPGRPTVFGRCGPAAVFGLPGNPVSVLVAGELFLVPALKAMMGRRQVHPRRREATLVATARHRTGRLAHVPGVGEEGEGRWRVRPLPYHGSAHIHALSQANCLIILPADAAVVEAPAVVEVVELSE
ncbi:MAG: gephyrin-like molybdotransferase Glp [Candidatus Brocadiia bacterium]